MEIIEQGNVMRSPHAAGSSGRHPAPSTVARARTPARGLLSADREVMDRGVIPPGAAAHHHRMSASLPTEVRIQFLSVRL
jgi:hypothetical protein